MPNNIEPIVDYWYSHLDKGQLFQVVAIDEQTGTIEVQHFDGDIEEIHQDNWQEMDIELSEPPEDWTGALDIAEQDDLGTDITDTQPNDWSEQQKDFRTPNREKLTQEPEDFADDFSEGFMEEEPWEGE
ncbi:MAG: hypothetical protein OEY67_01580 [Gammaproteobacteria bacterium]|nr:hypothetical protein [Gammaproteobacteria bacterium]